VRSNNQRDKSRVPRLRNQMSLAIPQPTAAKFTLGGIYKPKAAALPKIGKMSAPGVKMPTVKMPKIGKFSAPGRPAGTLRLNRLPLSKVRTGPGY
jgi:hypothetical protein